MDEVFYHDGQWYLYKQPEFELPPFELDWGTNDRMLRDWRWSMMIAPPPTSPIIVTGV